MISSWTFFWLADGDVIGSQHHQPSGSNWSVVYVLVVWIQLTSSTWWEVLYLQNSSKAMAQNIIYSLWGGTKCSLLCLMAKVLLFCLAWLFSFVSAFSHILLFNLFFVTWGSPRRLKIFYKQEAGEYGGDLPREGPRESCLLILSCIIYRYK